MEQLRAKRGGRQESGLSWESRLRLASPPLSADQRETWKNKNEEKQEDRQGKDASQT